MGGPVTLVVPEVVSGRFVQGMSEDEVEFPIDETHTTLIDRADLPIAESRKWRVIRGGSGKQYVMAGGAAGAFYLHRLIAQTPAGMETDHINGDSLDNRRANLRIASMAQNSANTGKPRPRAGRSHTSRFKGVSWASDRCMWAAYITVARRGRLLGRFATEEEAARAYDAAARATWGDFAYLNFPEEGR